MLATTRIGDSAEEPGVGVALHHASLPAPSSPPYTRRPLPTSWRSNVIPWWEDLVPNTVLSGRDSVGGTAGDSTRHDRPSMMLFVVLCLLGMVVALIAWRKGRNRHLWWLYGSLLFFVALPHALLMAPKHRCPHCDGQIEAKPRECPHCGRTL